MGTLMAACAFMKPKTTSPPPECRFGFLRLLVTLCCLGAALMPLGCGVAGSSIAAPTDSSAIESVTQEYVEQFYPLAFTYLQAQVQNRLLGPATVTPAYQVVVAVNVDTLYVSAFVNLQAQPVVLTIPATTATYSMLALDAFGNIYSTAIAPETPGTYGLIPPGYNGTLPGGITPIQMPLSFMELIFRTDNYSASGVNQSAQAEQFRESLLMQTLSNYEINPTGGAAAILPESPTFTTSVKTVIDNLIATNPITFLTQLQIAVASSNTPPLSSDQASVSASFNGLFSSGTLTTAQTAAFSAGAEAGYNAILNNYLNSTGPTNWISFTNIGNWGSNYLDRSSISEYIQCANNWNAAAYYQTFEDSNGAALNGANSNYILTFPAGQIPQAARFWSVTAYTPDSIELISNSADTYEVASYTPGLVTNADGSISIVMAQQLPPFVPASNWLPIPNSPFNIMLRVYGPEGSVLNQTYVPPAVRDF